MTLSKPTEQELSILTIHSIVYEATQLKQLHIPKNFRSVAKEFVIGILNFCDKVTDFKDWARVLRDKEDPDNFIDKFFESCPELVKKYKDELTPKYVRHEVVNSYAKFFKKLDRPSKGSKQNSFVHFICAVFVKTYECRFERKPSFFAIQRDLGEKVLNGYLQFINSEATLKNIWLKRLTVSESFKAAYRLNHCNLDTFDRALLEFEEPTVNKYPNEENEAQEIFDDFPVIHIVDNQEHLKEAEGIETKIFTAENEVIKTQQKIAALQAALESVKATEKKQLEDLSGLKHIHLKNNQNVFVSSFMRKIFSDEELFIENSRTVHALITSILAQKPESAKFKEWIEECVLVNGNKISLVDFGEEFNYTQPSNIKESGIQIDSRPSGWNECDSADDEIREMLGWNNPSCGITDSVTETPLNNEVASCPDKDNFIDENMQNDVSLSQNDNAHENEESIDLEVANSTTDTIEKNNQIVVNDAFSQVMLDLNNIAPPPKRVRLAKND